MGVIFAALWEKWFPKKSPVATGRVYFLVRAADGTIG